MCKCNYVDHEHYLLYSREKEINISEALDLISKYIDSMNEKFIELVLNVVIEH